jgi:serine/threonine-protein kinase RsbW
MEAAQTRSFAARPSEVAVMDDWIEAVGGQWGSDERALFAARLCVAELAANAVEHGTATQDDDRITVTLRRYGEDLEIEVLDTRTRFDPSSATPTAAPSPTETAIGGFGLRLVRAYAENLAYCHDGTHNRVTLTVKARAPLNRPLMPA